MDTSLSIQLQQAWLLTQIKKQPPPSPTPAFSPLIDPFPSSPNPWSSRTSDVSLDPSSPDFFWSDFAEVSDSWNPPAAPEISSSLSDGATLPNAWVVSAAQAVSGASDDDAFIPTSDLWASLTARGVFSPSDYWMPTPQSSEAVSSVVDPDASAGEGPGASVSNISSFEDDVLMDPVLEFINDMLMDEQMEDRKCMQQECSAYQAKCSAYQAIVNGFYEDLGEDSSSHCSSTKQSPSPSGNEARDDLSWIDDVFAADPTSTQQTATSALPSSWQFDSSSSNSSQQDSKPRSFDSSSSGSPYSQDSSVYTSGSHEDGSWNGAIFPERASVLTPNYPIGALVNSSAKTLLRDSGKQAVHGVPYQGVGLSRFDSGAGNGFSAEPPSQIYPRNDTDDGMFRRVKSEDHKFHTSRYPRQMNASDYGGYKRAISDKVHDKSRQSRSELRKLAGDSRHSGNGSYGSVNGGAQAHDSEEFEVKKGQPRDLDLRDVSSGNSSSENSDEKFSFVKNENLNAERNSKMYGEWWPSDKCFEKKLEARSNAVPVKRSGKPDSVDLRGLLVSCAQAVASNDLRKANDLVQEIRQHASPYGSAAQRLAHYFAEGLVARISGTGARLYTAMSSNRPSAAKMLKAFHRFVEVCPYARISHYFANQSIFKAAEGASRLHIVDYGILYGVQWPCLISALADREGGPPSLRITAIEFPQPGLNPAERLEETGRRLAEYAKTYNVPFEYRCFACKWEDVEPAHMHLKQGEVLAVNCIHRLHHLLDESVVAASPRKKVLGRMHSLNPDILLVAAVNAGYNAPFFVSRFREALYHYSSKFDMIDTTVDSDDPERFMLEREVMGRDILNVVACEGPERMERPETYRQWQGRFQRAGFEQLPLNSSMVSKARAVVNGLYHKDFGVDEDSKWMLLGWKGRIVDALSAWRPSSAGTGK